jgi:MFS family permease
LRTASVQSESNLAEDFPPRVRRVYLSHALASVGSNLLIPAFFFYATSVFHWDSIASLKLVSAEGVVYIVGALMARKLANYAGRRRGLLLIQVILASITALAWAHPTPALVVVVLLLYTMVSASAWPMFESLISAGASADLLSRRIGLYNLIWSGVGTLTLAVSGVIIDHFLWGMFVIPMLAHLVVIAILVGQQVSPAIEEETGHAAPEPALAAQRRLALQLSRIGLPATYTVLYSLVALMPSLAVIESFGPADRTAIASIWMATRFAAFAVLGFTAWWHTRPRLLLWSAVLMLAAFLGVTLRGADLAGHPGSPVTAMDQWLMIGWQIPLGITMGVIYSGSLYFGMVLSEGSTEHGGYHEALIGVGQVVGPAAALAAQRVRPDDHVAAVTAVAGVLTMTLLAAAAVTIHHAIQSGSPAPTPPPPPD